MHSYLNSLSRLQVSYNTFLNSAFLSTRSDGDGRLWHLVDVSHVTWWVVWSRSARWWWRQTLIISWRHRVEDSAVELSRVKSASRSHFAHSAELPQGWRHWLWLWPHFALSPLLSSFPVCLRHCFDIVDAAFARYWRRRENHCAAVSVKNRCSVESKGILCWGLCGDDCMTHDVSTLRVIERCTIFISSVTLPYVANVSISINPTVPIG